MGNIEMGKKYRCRDGMPATVLAVGLNAQLPVVFVRHSSPNENVICVSADGLWGTMPSGIDLVEIGPYDDFKIDEKVMVSHGGIAWFKRHFAGVDEDGQPTAFDNGSTRWSKPDYDPTRWNYCRRPTPEELGE